MRALALQLQQQWGSHREMQQQLPLLEIKSVDGFQGENLVVMCLPAFGEASQGTLARVWMASSNLWSKAKPASGMMNPDRVVLAFDRQSVGAVVNASCSDNAGKHKYNCLEQPQVLSAHDCTHLPAMKT